MNSFIATAGPPAMLAVTIGALLSIRARPDKTRLVVEGLLLLVLTGCFALWGASPLHANFDLARRPDAVWLRALAVIWWLMGARFLASFAVIALGRDARSRQARLLSDLVAAAIYATAALVVMTSVLGLQIKGLLATSGVIAIVLGLASQNTLADVFSGIAVGIDKPFKVGDRVSIGDQEGVVVQVNWRAIRVQTDGEDIAMIPNSIVAKSLIINRSVPTLRRKGSIDVPVQTSARSESLIDLLHQAILLSPALLTEPPASVALKHLGFRTTTFSIGYYVASSANLSTARGQLLRQIRRLFRHAGISTEAPLTSKDVISALRLFESLTPDQVGQLDARLTPKALRQDEHLYREGDRGASMYIIKSGVLEITRKGSGGAAPMDACGKAFARLGPGECLGEISMMSGKPHPVSARALTRCEVLELPRTELEGLLQADHALGDALEQAVNRGLALIDQDDAARLTPALAETPSLLNQVRQFLRRWG